MENRKRPIENGNEADRTENFENIFVRDPGLIQREQTSVKERQ
jgi:hypothetical protein